MLSNPNPDGLPLVFLVRRRVNADFLDVYLPTRPNGSTGVVRASDVTLSSVVTQVKVELRYHRLTAWAGDDIIAQHPVAVGAPRTPTPTGLFYFQEVLRTPNPRWRLRAVRVRLVGALRGV